MKNLVNTISIYLMSHERTIMNLTGIAIAFIGYCISIILVYINEPQFSAILIILIVLSTLALGFTIWDLHKQEREKLTSSKSGSISPSRDISYPCLIMGGSKIVGGSGPDGLSVADFTEGIGLGWSENKRQKSYFLQNDETNKYLFG